MTCENCIHYDICNENADGNIVELMGKPCFRFKDKDSFNVKWREWNTVPNKNGDLISRSALLAEYDRQHKGEAGRARKLMEDAPAVDAVEVKHGFWDDSGRYKFPSGAVAIRCSECGCALHESEYRLYNWHYCPCCGAKMDGERKENASD